MDPALTAAAIGVGGTVIVGVAGFWANVRNTNKTTALALQGQVADRYTKAVDQLGSDKEIDVRIGGIYALEGIARDSPRDHPTIMEVLAAFIRGHSHEQWPPAEPGAEPPPHRMRPDVQAAATVIGRRTVRYDSQHVNLESADLSLADLSRANLKGADLSHANLARANFHGADLTGAFLLGADLAEAGLFDANLTGAVLRGANLTGAFLSGANLTGADLRDANLTGVRPTTANLDGAQLSGALWPPDVKVPEGWIRGTDSRLLQ